MNVDPTYKDRAKQASAQNTNSRTSKTHSMNNDTWLPRLRAKLRDAKHQAERKQLGCVLDVPRYMNGTFTCETRRLASG